MTGKKKTVFTAIAEVEEGTQGWETVMLSGKVTPGRATGYVASTI